MEGYQKVLCAVYRMMVKVLVLISRPDVSMRVKGMY